MLRARTWNVDHPMIWQLWEVPRTATHTTVHVGSILALLPSLEEQGTALPV
jgi:hypothetical protein